MIFISKTFFPFQFQFYAIEKPADYGENNSFWTIRMPIPDLKAISELRNLSFLIFLHKITQEFKSQSYSLD